MGASEILSIGSEAIWVLLKISLPIMLVALTVGLIISLFQALTQIQEMTLSFVPKIIAIAFALIMFMPFIGSTLVSFSEELYTKIAEIENSEEDE
ncbi:MAG: flagellar biosynthetic protein FliQ [Alphaproteobacteria bacterium CG11_big_fil_rev_8_21_14_0_20_44_7]|nr:MAG: flagellar biosynthetic protein FliQ [Alphaproteobacteria bacterium CG11_big_fil_rev_8_21_14_0_20_44_7]